MDGYSGFQPGGSQPQAYSQHVDDLREKVNKVYDAVFINNGGEKALVSQVSYLKAAYDGLKKSIEDLEAKVSTMSSKLDKYVYLGVSTVIGILVNIVIHILEKR